MQVLHDPVHLDTAKWAVALSRFSGEIPLLRASGPGILSLAGTEHPEHSAGRRAGKAGVDAIGSRTPLLIESRAPGAVRIFVTNSSNRTARPDSAFRATALRGKLKVTFLSMGGTFLIYVYRPVLESLGAWHLRPSAQPYR